MREVEEQIKQARALKPSKPSKIQEPDDDDDELAAPRANRKRNRSKDAMAPAPVAGALKPTKSDKKRARAEETQQRESDPEDGEPVLARKSEIAKGKRAHVKEGCVARWLDESIVFVTSIEDEEAIVLSKDAAKKRGLLVDRA